MRKASISLPHGYSQLDYIEATGTQYIDTGFTSNQDTRIVCEFMWLGGDGIYGGRKTTSSRNFSLRVIQNVWQPGYGGYTATKISANNNWHIADQNKNFLYIDGVLIAECPMSTFTNYKPTAIGAINAEKQIYYGKGRYRACRIYDNGTLVRDMIPCIDPGGSVGMYDMVYRTFYSSAGAGAFIAGFMSKTHLYNDTPLPSPPNYDKTVCPYITIVKWINKANGSEYGFVAAQSPLVMNSGYLQVDDSADTTKSYGVFFDYLNGEWAGSEEISGVGVTDDFCIQGTPIWTAQDIYNVTVSGSAVNYDTLYLPASNPVPVTAPTIDPLWFYMGWQAGSWIARQRVKNTEEPTNPNLASQTKLSSNNTNSTIEGFTWHLAKTGSVDGLIFNTNDLIVGETYTFSLKVKKISGSLQVIGGHSEAFSERKFTINGIEQEGTYMSGVTVADNEEIYEVVYTGVYHGNANNKNWYFQPNRKLTVATRCDVWDVKIEVGDRATPWVPAEEDVCRS